MEIITQKNSMEKKFVKANEESIGISMDIFIIN
jgi:hypothetical protein